MTSFLTKCAAAGLALAVTVAGTPFVSSADAGHRGWKGHHHHHHYYGPRRGHGGAAAAAGIIGFATGAILGSALSQPRHYYAPPPRAYYRTAPAYRYSYAPEPWTPDWYAYCASKYRSFDVHTGTYMTYSGYRRVCQ